MLLTADAANKSNAFQECFYCSAKQQAVAEGSKASSYAEKAEELLLPLLPPNYPLLTESRWLRGRFGAYDFSLPVEVANELRWVHVEVDGEQHFHKPRQGELLGQQLEVDRRKDAETMKQGRMLVRLHYADKDIWKGVLAGALKLAAFPRQQRFLFYSPSYTRPPLELQTKVEFVKVRGRKARHCTHIVHFLVVEASGVVDPPVAHQPHVAIDSHAHADLAAVAVVVVLGFAAGGEQVVSLAVDGGQRHGALVHCELIYKHPLQPVAARTAVLMAEAPPHALLCRCEHWLGWYGAAHEAAVHLLHPTQQVSWGDVGQGAQCLERRVEPARLQQWQRIVLG